MTLHEWVSDLYWLRQRRRAPLFVHRLTGNRIAEAAAQELERVGIFDRKETLLYLLVRALHPSTVVETGVEWGKSSRAILTAMSENGTGHLTSVDLPTIGPGRRNEDGVFDTAHVDAAEQTGRLVPAFLRDRWTLRLATSADDAVAHVVDALRSCRPVDLFFHDSDHSFGHMLAEYRQAWPYLRPGGVLYSDDVDWNAAFTEFAREVERPAWRFRVQVRGATVGGLVR